MIVNWKSDGPERFVTEWRGMYLDLTRLPSGRWGLVVTADAEGAVLACNSSLGAVVRQRWDTLHAIRVGILTFALLLLIASCV